MATLKDWSDWVNSAPTPIERARRKNTAFIYLYGNYTDETRPSPQEVAGP